MPVVIRNNRLAARQTVGFSLLILLAGVVLLAPLLALLPRAAGAGRVVVVVLLALAVALVGFLAYCLVRSWLIRAVIDERGILVCNLIHNRFVPWSQIGGLYTEKNHGRGRPTLRYSPGPWPVAVLSLSDGTHVRVRVTYAPNSETTAYSFIDTVRSQMPGAAP